METMMLRRLTGEEAPAAEFKAVPSRELINQLFRDCKTFAGGIERALGRPPYWANCTDPGDDDDSIKACIEGYTPALVKSIRFYLPKCEELQKSYKISVIAGQPKSKGYDVTAPDCQRMLSLAKSWRPDLPDILKPCEGYDPDKTAEHVNACLAPEKIYIHMRNCQEVRAKYKYFVGLANGSMPADFYPLPCDQAEPLLAKAAALREKRRKEAEEFERKMAEIQARKKKAKQEYIYKLEEKMAKKYADSPENVASRTSALEKQIKATGQIPKSCNGYYCPPTKEEMRLAMMRNQSQKIGLRIINGHLMHGKLPTMATYMMMFAGQQGKGTIGVEAHYKEVQMIYDCKFVNGAYECYFKLPFTTKYDELTSMYMDGLSSGLPFNLNDMVHNMIGNALAREEYSYLFQIDAGGLWRASPTMQQEMRDMKKQLNSIQSQIH